VLWFVQLEFMTDVWHEAHWGTVTKTKIKITYLENLKKKENIWKGSVNDVVLQPLKCWDRRFESR